MAKRTNKAIAEAIEASGWLDSDEAQRLAATDDDVFNARAMRGLGVPLETLYAKQLRRLATMAEV